MPAPIVELVLIGWTAIIDPENLTVKARINGETDLFLAATGPRHEIASLVRTGQSVKWAVPAIGITVQFSARANRLLARIESSREQTIEWPHTGDDARITALILP